MICRFKEVNTLENGPQCYDCGKHVEYLVDDGVCQNCLDNRKEDNK